MAKGDEFDVIELIDADAAAFGPSPGRDRAAKERRRPADDQWLLLPAAWVVVGALLLGTLAWLWQPWRDRPEMAVGPITSVETTLTERLVLDRSIFPGQVVQEGAVGVDLPPDGYVLLDPAMFPWETNPQNVRAAVVAVSGEDLRDGDVPGQSGWTPIADIQGAPAEYQDDGEQGIQVVFGPVDDQWYQVQSFGLGLDATVALAAVARWTSHGLIIMDRSRLSGLELRYPFDSYWRAIGIVQASQPSALGWCDCTSVVYPGRFTVSVSSVVAPHGGELDVLRDLLDGAEAVMVHELPAVLVRGTDGTFMDGWDFVAWVEGGRLIGVAVDRGHGADVLGLAESVRPATDEEWAELTTPEPSVVLTSVPYETVPDNPASSSTTVIVADNGSTISIEADDTGATVCVTAGAGGWTCTAAEFAATASIVVVGEGINTFAVALTNLPTGQLPPTLTVTHPDGSSSSAELQWQDGTGLPGPVAALAVGPGDHVQIVDPTGVLAETDV